MRSQASTHEMNICNVNTDVWQSSLMKLDASMRHSEGYFFEVKPVVCQTFIINLSGATTHTHHDRDPTDEAEAF
jgi:hypothetical protein